MRAKGSREAITWEYVTDASEGEKGGQMVAKGNFRRLIPWALPEHSRKHFFKYFVISLQSLSESLTNI